MEQTTCSAQKYQITSQVHQMLQRIYNEPVAQYIRRVAFNISDCGFPSSQLPADRKLEATVSLITTLKQHKMTNIEPASLID